MDLEGKVALITGASSGIGKAIALELDKAGMKLILTARSADKLEDLANKCSDAKVYAANITEPEVPQKLLDFALDTFGRLDVLINNAGMMSMGGIDEIDIENICLMVRLNVELVYRMAYTVLRHFKQNGTGFLSILKHSELFSPLSMGDLTLPNRIMVAPVTRSRSALPGNLQTPQRGVRAIRSSSLDC